MPTLGRYILERRIAAGGMAEVFLARQTGSYGFVKHVALKVLKQEVSRDDDNVRMFVREALVAAEFRHPNLAQVYEVGEEHGRLFIAMELVRGVSVAALIKGLRERNRTLPLNVAVRIAIDALDGLAHAHEAKGSDGKPLGLVHRDISPQNIMVSVDGTVKVVDFGIARAETAFGRTIAPKIKGKFHYMAPEQWDPHSTLDARADLFALGVVLYEMTTGGARLFQGDTPQELYRAIVMDPIPDPRSRVPDYPPELAAIVMRALERGPAARWPSARAMRTALVDFAQKQNWSLSSRAVADTVRDALGPGEIETRWEPVTDDDFPAKSLPAETSPVAGQTVTIQDRPSPIPRWSRLRRLFVTITGAVVVAAMSMALGFALGRRREPTSSSAGQTTLTNVETVRHDMDDRRNVGRTVVRVRGTAIVTRMDSLRTRWNDTHPETELRLEPAVSTQAIQALITGNVDVAVTMRPPTQEEITTARDRGVDLGEHARIVIGHAMARVAVHPSNSVPTLDVDQIRRIFRAEPGASWSTYGSDAGTIRVVLREPTTELLALVRETLFHGTSVPNGVESVESEEAARALVASDPHAVTVLTLATIEQSMGTVRPASADTVLKYPVYAITRGVARGTARTVIDWLRAPDIATLLHTQGVITETNRVQ